MIAAAIYFKPMPGRYHNLDQMMGLRMDTASGKVERCGFVAVGGSTSIKGIPRDKLAMFRLDPNGNRQAEQFDEAFGKGAADKAQGHAYWYRLRAVGEMAGNGPV
ncbi:MAG: hypothetical protein ACRETW_09290 [Stenotrophobium sp.]